MQINSPEALRLASQVFDEAGHNWELVRQASTVRADGVRVIDRARLAKLRSEAEAAAH